MRRLYGPHRLATRAWAVAEATLDSIAGSLRAATTAAKLSRGDGVGRAGGVHHLGMGQVFLLIA
jgi:hypothetical protein